MQSSTMSGLCEYCAMGGRIAASEGWGTWWMYVNGEFRARNPIYEWPGIKSSNF